MRATQITDGCCTMQGFYGVHITVMHIRAFNKPYERDKTQCSYNVTVGLAGETIVAVEKQ